jgi:lipopolysaccharide/colanic/teichoic acid biosynthesis glycosyltransferase
LQNSFYVRYGKRACDAALSLAGLVALSPVFLVCAVLIKATSRGPVFFRQARTGLDGKPFRIFKFRSMFCRPQSEGSLLTASGDKRITPVGKWLRKTKADELPQLLNVLLGQMSLVGPRPEVSRYTDQYTKRQKGILSLRPGITGLASIAFSSEERVLAAQPDPEHFYLTTLMPLKVDMELQYSQRITFLGDLRILFQTFVAISGDSKPIVGARNTADLSTGSDGPAKFGFQ